MKLSSALQSAPKIIHGMQSIDYDKSQKKPLALHLIVLNYHIFSTAWRGSYDDSNFLLIAKEDEQAFCVLYDGY